MANKFIIAAAGSGKTTHIVEESLAIENRNVLITTYTEANESEIRSKIISKKGYIPSNIHVQTWFSFLLQHGVRPYQDAGNQKLWGTNIGFILAEGRSGIHTSAKGHFSAIGKGKLTYFFTSESDPKIFSDKISDFIIRCNDQTGGEVIKRISRIYPHIFVDEVQDMAGYDLDILTLLLGSNSCVTLVGDPRQGTYSTNNSLKNKKFQKSGVVEYFEGKKSLGLIEIDSTSFAHNHRCNQAICDISDSLFPDYVRTTSTQSELTGHDGVFFISESEIVDYLKEYPECVQLRDSIKEGRNIPGYRVMNFGASKGLTFERVLIFPTNPITKWMADKTSELAPTTRSKLYVALTRAKYSITIVR